MASFASAALPIPLFRLNVPISSSRSSSLFSGNFANALTHSVATLQPSRAGPGLLQVRAAKGRRRMPTTGPTVQTPSIPSFDPDDDTPKFVIFIRLAEGRTWYPLTVVTGGSTAKALTGVMESEFGLKLFQSYITRSIGAAIYKDELSLQEAAIKQFAVLKGAKNFVYGYKILDRKNPKSSLMGGSGVIRVPPREALKSLLERVKDVISEKVTNLQKSIGGLAK
eukprot:TRINITY_DN2282_c0_g1_i1.p1 TRINITY_DN2282_c0_g1~~TRINITY_DN2282_c0_g1_i1.p1  ORF type:complete len:232 (+),score=48.21 TRINITY_DN2282_c0_g1_i1:26-697(+)